MAPSPAAPRPWSRAVTVAVLVLAARALDHRAQALNVLAMAALLAVAAVPVVVLDAGFLLSFGATAGILLGVPLLSPGSAEPRHRVSAARKAGGVVRTMLAATVCAELALAPVAATLFGRVSFAGFVLNFAAIPLMSVVQIGGLVIAASATVIAPLAFFAARTVHAAALALLASAALVDVAPWLVVDVPPPVWWLTAAYYAALAGVLARRATRFWAMCSMLAAALLLTGPRFTARDAVPRSRLPLRVVVLDVGQGDATVVSLPGGTAMLVDTGGLALLSTGADGAEPAGFDVGERVVVPALRALGVTRLESVVITHGDPDHLMGAPGIVRHLPPHSIWEGVPVPPHAGLQRLAAWAIERGASWRRVQAGDVERFGDVELRVLHPPPPDWERQRVRNEDSVVLELRLGSVSVVLPGDIGREGEHALLPRLEPGRLVVLKAPHHGSATSSTAELLDVLRPAAVIFSAGRNNRFGHPHPAVVERYRAIGSADFLDGGGRGGVRGDRWRRRSRCGGAIRGVESRSARQPPHAETGRRRASRLTKGTKTRRARRLVVQGGLMLNVDLTTDRIGRTDRHRGGRLRLSRCIASLGPGFKESIYRRAFCLELDCRGLSFECEKTIDVRYKDWTIPGQRVDLSGWRNRARGDQSSCRGSSALHRGQVLSYLKTMDLHVGLLMNFNSDVLTRHGVQARRSLR